MMFSKNQSIEQTLPKKGKCRWVVIVLTKPFDGMYAT